MRDCDGLLIVRLDFRATPRRSAHDSLSATTHCAPARNDSWDSRRRSIAAPARPPSPNREDPRPLPFFLRGSSDVTRFYENRTPGRSIGPPDRKRRGGAQWGRDRAATERQAKGDVALLFGRFFSALKRERRAPNCAPPRRRLSPNVLARFPDFASFVPRATQLSFMEAEPRTKGEDTRKLNCRLSVRRTWFLRGRGTPEEIRYCDYFVARREARRKSLPRGYSGN